MTKQDKKKEMEKGGVSQESGGEHEIQKYVTKILRKGAGTHKWLKGEKKKLGMGRTLSKTNI